MDMYEATHKSENDHNQVFTVEGALHFVFLRHILCSLHVRQSKYNSYTPLEGWKENKELNTPMNIPRIEPRHDEFGSDKTYTQCVS